MKTLCIALMLCIVGYAQDYSQFLIDNKVEFQEDYAKHKAKYRSHQAEKKARRAEGKAKQLFLNKNQFSLPQSARNIESERSTEDFFEKFGKRKEDKLFKKVLIKSRSHKNPEKYHYTVIRKRSDLKKAGVVVDKNQRIKRVYNYVEIKNVHGAKKENVGVIVKKGSKVKEVTNIVNIKHSKLINKKVNAGIEIEDKKATKKIYNEVELKDSKLGEW